jgi:DNA polymerase-1
MSKSAASMEWSGVLIDVARIKDMEKEYDKKIAEVNTRLSALVKMEYFNVNSAPQMQKVLFGKEKGCLNLSEHKKLKGKLKRTKKGNLSTDKDTFELIRRIVTGKRVLKVLDLIQEVRTMRKMRSTYLTGFRKIVDPNNRVHTSYLTTGTVTGRYASEGPNLQNIPRDPIFRSLFIAGPGRKMIPADYSQIEARLIAWLANEVKYIEKFADPKFDPHYFNSSIVRKKPMEDVTKEERSYDKAVTFGLNYGRSNRSIAETYDLPQEFVDNFVREYFKGLPRIKRWRDKQISISKIRRENGSYYLQSNVGRRRHFFAYEWMFSEEMQAVKRRKRSIGDFNEFSLDFLTGTMERQAINFPIQSYASDLLSKATAKVRKRLKKDKLDAFLVLSVHDMIAIDGSEQDIEKAAKILDEEMPFTKSRGGGKLKLHFPADYEITDHWVQ